MNYYLEVFKKYATFNGRARRKEYWTFWLVNFIIGLALTLLKITPVLIIFHLAILIPSLAVATRRLHDTDHSGWWLFITLIPFIGAIVFIVFMALNSQAGENKYGPNPKRAASN